MVGSVNKSWFVRIMKRIDFTLTVLFSYRFSHYQTSLCAPKKVSIPDLTVQLKKKGQWRAPGLCKAAQRFCGSCSGRDPPRGTTAFPRPGELFRSKAQRRHRGSQRPAPRGQRLLPGLPPAWEAPGDLGSAQSQPPPHTGREARIWGERFWTNVTEARGLPGESAKRATRRRPRSTWMERAPAIRSSAWEAGPRVRGSPRAVHACLPGATAALHLCGRHASYSQTASPRSACFHSRLG